MRKIIIIMILLLITGCKSAIEINENAKPIFSHQRGDYRLDFLQMVNNETGFKVTFDLLNTDSNSNAYIIGGVEIIDDDATKYKMTGAGEGCKYFQKFGLIFPEKLYPETKVRYKFCFKEIDQDKNPKLYFNIKTLDEDNDFGATLIVANLVGDKTLNTIDLAPYLGVKEGNTLAEDKKYVINTKEKNDIFTIRDISYNGSIKILLQNNDIVDYDQFYLVITKTNKLGEFSIPLMIKKKILQGRMIRVDTAYDLLKLDGSPYQLKNIDEGDNFTFNFYKSYTDKGEGLLVSKSYIICSSE